MELFGQDLTCERGGRIVFRNVSLSLRPGQLMQLTGQLHAFGDDAQAQAVPQHHHRMYDGAVIRVSQ